MGFVYALGGRAWDVVVFGIGVLVVLERADVGVEDEMCYVDVVGV